MQTHYCIDTMLNFVRCPSLWFVNDLALSSIKSIIVEGIGDFSFKLLSFVYVACIRVMTD